MQGECERIVGYALFSIGIGMLFFSTYEMVQVFTGASPPPNMSSFSDISFPMPGQEEPVLIVSGKLIAMVFLYMLMFFIVWVGQKIAFLGIDMIKGAKSEEESRIKTEEKEAEKTISENYPENP